jgi:prophage maintenance system killer protein
VRFINQSVADEYARWIDKIGPDPFSSSGGVGIHEVLRAHFSIVDHFLGLEYGIGGVGPRDTNLLHSAVSRQFVAYGLREKWTEPLQKCATLLFGLVKDHPFHDANKRTAFLTCLFHLESNSIRRVPSVTQKDFEDFIVEVADNKLARYKRYVDLTKSGPDPEVLFIYDFLKRNTRAIDKRRYTVTFHVLNQILKKYGFELTNPDKNYIDLVRLTEDRGIFGLRRKPQIKQDKIATVGFPGWTKQVSDSDLKKVRAATGLTAEKGYDSRVLFGDADPLPDLISRYEAPLRRLAYR